jgi:ABC-2 type transport system ATP-binding protein
MTHPAEPSEEPLIRFIRVSKSYGKLFALKKFSLTITKGQSIGLVGPNGAGKTTFIRILCGLMPLNEGEVYYNGKFINAAIDNEKNSGEISSRLRQFRQEIGFVPQTTTIDEQLTARENLELQADLFKLAPNQINSRIREILKEVGLSNRGNEKVKTFSGGMRRRLEIARALIHNPTMLILDEPTLGLDPSAKNHIWNFIRDLNQKTDLTLLVTTNNMQEAERLCDEIVIIDHGRKIINGTPKVLISGIKKKSVFFKITPIDRKKMQNLIKTIKAPAKINQISVKMLENSNIRQPEDKDGEIEVDDDTGLDEIGGYVYNSDSEKILTELIGLLHKENIEITEINYTKPSLDDVFIYYIGGMENEMPDYVRAVDLVSQELWADQGNK